MTFLKAWRLQRARERYAERYRHDEGFRARKQARATAWYYAHREAVLARLAAQRQDASYGPQDAPGAANGTETPGRVPGGDRGSTGRVDGHSVDRPQ